MQRRAAGPCGGNSSAPTQVAGRTDGGYPEVAGTIADGAPQGVPDAGKTRRHPFFTYVLIAALVGGSGWILKLSPRATEEAARNQAASGKTKFP